MEIGLALEQLAKLSKFEAKKFETALHKMWQLEPELYRSVVISAYLDGQINLGKAAKLLGKHRLELQEEFIQQGIPLRIGPATVEEAKAEVESFRIDD